MAQYGKVNRITISHGDDGVILMTTELDVDIDKLVDKTGWKTPSEPWYFAEWGGAVSETDKGALLKQSTILTLVQTNKTRHIPIILVHEPFWAGLIDWFKTTLVNEGTINAEDLDLIQILDKPKDLLDAIFSHYEISGFEPSAEEAEILLDL